MSRNEAFAPWQCPLCGGALQGENDLKCEKGHCFDRAREGYWHLLPVQSMRTKAPGDSKEMVAARRAFLNAGYYGIFGQALGELCLAHGVPAAKDAPLHLLDAGCGEGWYDRCIAQQFAAAEKPLQLAGFDIDVDSRLSVGPQPLTAHVDMDRARVHRDVVRTVGDRYRSPVDDGRRGQQAVGQDAALNIEPKR